MKTHFKDSPRSYLLILSLGTLAGLAVVLFIDIPDDPFWTFYYWSSSTFGFWMFSTSLIVLSSENRKCAALNAGIYIFMMFLITTAHQSLLSYLSGVTGYTSLAQLTVNHAPGWLVYSAPPALMCAALGAVLWSGRQSTVRGRLLRLLPALFLLAEAALMLYRVLAEGTCFFSALTDLICLLVYLFIIQKQRTAD